jgi:predicted ATPase
MGKSRLALTLARQVQRGEAQSFLNGVVWVSLAGLATVESLPLLLVNALRLPVSGQSEPQRQLVDFLQNKEMLLVLDNFEHVMAGQSQLLGQILAACPDVKLLVTSWEPLNLAAEWRYDLAGLAYPRANQDDLESFGAVQLFAQTARQARASFQLSPENRHHVAALCQLVGGMPLAIKLAAAWLRMMQVQDVVAEVERGLDLLATQMRDVPERQRSMRAIFEQTWALLTAPEQRAMALLSVFYGGFRRQAAERVAGANLPMLTLLMDRSLIQSDENGRYFVHELLRQFAAEKLAQDTVELERTQARHIQFFTGLLEQQAKPMAGAGQRQAVALVAADIENICLAWQRVVDEVDVATIARSVDVLIAFFDLRGWYRAGIDLLEGAVRQLQHQPAGEEVQALLARLYVHLGWVYIRVGQYEKATEVTTRSQRIYHELEIDPPRGVGTEPLVGLGVLANIRGDYDAAFRLGDEARRLSEMRGDGDNLQNAYAVLTSTAFAQGRYAEAEEYARQAHHFATIADNQWFLAYILDDLGMIESALGNDEEAAHYYERSYALRQAFGDPAGMAITSMHMAEVALQQQRWAEANERYERSLKGYYETNDRGGLAVAHEGMGRVAAAQGDIAAAQSHFHSALLTASQIGYTPALLSILTAVAEFLLQSERKELALAALQIVNAHRSSNATTLQRAARLLALHAVDLPEAKVSPTQKELDALVTRLLVELALQHR